MNQNLNLVQGSKQNQEVNIEPTWSGERRIDVFFLFFCGPSQLWTFVRCGSFELDDLMILNVPYNKFDLDLWNHIRFYRRTSEAQLQHQTADRVLYIQNLITPSGCSVSLNTS